MVHVAAAVVADGAANVFRQSAEVADQIFSGLLLQIGMLFHRGIQFCDISRVVLVVMKMHGCFVNVGLQRVVRVG